METFSFSTNTLFIWLKGEVSVDSRFVKTKIPNTVMGLIPAGSDSQNIPLKNISGSMTSSKLLMKPLILGFFMFMIGFNAMADSFMFGLILLLLGLASMGNGIVTELILEKAGTAYRISVPFFEKGKINMLNGYIQQALAADTDKTDLNMFFDKKEQTETV